MDKILFSDINSQIKKLKQQKLIIRDENTAKSMLETFGYSNLIKSYRAPYVINTGNKKKYKPDVSFEQVASLYFLDKDLRNTVMSAMQDFEEHLKECIAYVLAQNYGTDPQNYLKYSNFRDRKKVTNPKFNLKNILDTIKGKLNTDKDPIKHYSDKYGIVPPWILFKSVYFSTIVNFVRYLKRPQKIELVNKLYDLRKLGLSEDQGIKLMQDTLFLCLDYRNYSAHGGRIYNYISDSKIRTNEIFSSQNKNLPSESNLGMLLRVLNLLKYKNPFDRLSSSLNYEINRHCSSFPQDKDYLAEIFDVHITAEIIVFTSQNGTIYHNDSTCSGIKNATAIKYEDAINKKLIPCKKCVGKS